MGRPSRPLPVDKIEPALAYLQRAVDRGVDFFTCGSKEVRRSLAHLRKQGLTLRRPDFAAEANTWLATHVSSEGRRTMLTALRQKESAAKRDAPSRALRLPAAAHADVMTLAHRLAVSPSAAVATLAKAALARPELWHHVVGQRTVESNEEGLASE